MKNKLTATIAALLFTAVFTACAKNVQTDTAVNQSQPQETETKTVHIGFTGDGNDWYGGAVGVAQINGYFDEELAKIGYKPDLQGFAGLGPAMNEALAAKELDYAFYMEIPAITAKSKGFDTVIVETSSIAAGSYIIASKDSNATTLEDLKGKKIGYTRGTVYHTFLINALESAGLTVDDVELVNLSADDMVSSILTGAIDAASLTASNALRLETEYDAAVTIATSDQRDEWKGVQIVAARGEYLQENEGVTEAIIKAIIRGRQTIIDNPETFYEIAAERGNQTVENVKKLYPADNDFAIYPVESNALVLSILKRTEQLMYDNQLIDSHVDIDAWVDNSYYERAAASLGN